MLIDTHAHIFDEYYNDVESILNLSKEKGIEIIINSGCDNRTNKEVINKSNRFKNLYFTIGIHPEYADIYTSLDIEFIKNNLNNKKAVGIGEIGLDYHYENFDKLKQQELLNLQMQIAQENYLPVVIHSRQATEDTLKIVKKYPNVKGVIHSFSGSIELAKEYVKMGYLLGVGGVVTFKNAHIKEVIKEIGLENILLETDSPYLTPEPKRGTQNYPGNIEYIVDFLSEYLNIPRNEISKITTNNVKKIFKKIDL